jgi:hypothetical protein
MRDSRKSAGISLIQAASAAHATELNFGDATMRQAVADCLTRNLFRTACLLTISTVEHN